MWQTCQPYALVAFTPRRYPRYSFVLRLSRPQGHSEAGRIKWMQNATYPVGNRTRDHPACGAVPQPNMPPRWHICFHLEVLTAVLLKIQVDVTPCAWASKPSGSAQSSTEDRISEDLNLQGVIEIAGFWRDCTRATVMSCTLLREAGVVILKWSVSIYFIYDTVLRDSI